MEKEILKKDWRTSQLGGLCGAMGTILGLAVSKVYFPEGYGLEKLTLGALTAAGLCAIFHLAVVRPRIIRQVERKANRPPE